MSADEITNRVVGIVDPRYRRMARLCWGMLLGIAVLGLILGSVVLKLRHDQQLAKDACDRTERFGPYIAAFFEREHVMPPRELALYRLTIPSHCN